MQSQPEKPTEFGQHRKQYHSIGITFVGIINSIIQFLLQIVHNEINHYTKPTRNKLQRINKKNREKIFFLIFYCLYIAHFKSEYFKNICMQVLENQPKIHCQLPKNEPKMHLGGLRKFGEVHKVFLCIKQMNKNFNNGRIPQERVMVMKQKSCLYLHK